MDNQEIPKMMIENINKFAQYSHEIEEKREESLIRQSGLTITAISLFSAVYFNFLQNNFGIISKTSVALLIASLICALLVGWRYKYTNFPYAYDFYNYVEENKEYYQTQFQFDWQFQNCLKLMQISQKNNNDKRVKFLMSSHILFALSIIFAFVSLGGVL